MEQFDKFALETRWKPEVSRDPVKWLPDLNDSISGTAYVVYEDIWDAKNACDHLSGFNVCNRYLVVLYYQATKAFKQQDLSAKELELEKMKTKYNISSDDLRK